MYVHRSLNRFFECLLLSFAFYFGHLSQSSEPQCLSRAEIEAILGDKLMSNTDVQRGFQIVVSCSVR